MQSYLVRLVNTPMIRRGFEQLVKLETENRPHGTVYTCPSGLHDDLGISFAMLAWAAQHQHLAYWVRNLQHAQRPRRISSKSNWAAFT